MMRLLRACLRGLCLALVLGAAGLSALPAHAADYPAPQPGTWVARDFRFHTGEVMAELKLAYVTLGNPQGEPVLVLHGTAGSAASMLTPAFAGELFGAGQPLDASRHFIIIPDALGAGKSAKPSDGGLLVRSRGARGRGCIRSRNRRGRNCPHAVGRSSLALRETGR